MIAQDNWQVNIDSQDDQFHKPQAIAATADGGVIVSGYTRISPNIDIFFSKISPSGEIEFTKYYVTQIREQADDILQLANGNYALLGVTSSESYILIFDTDGNLIETIDHETKDVSLRKMIELENGDFLLAGVFPKKNEDPLLGPDSQPYFSRITNTGQIIWSTIIYTNSSESLIDAIVFEDLVIGCGFTNRNPPTRGYVYSVKLETGEFVWEEDYFHDVFFSDIEKKGGSIVMIANSKNQKTHVVEINKFGEIESDFYSDQFNSRGVALLLGEHSNDIYTGETFKSSAISNVTKSKLVHYIDDELICEEKFKDGDSNYLRELTYTSDGNIAGILEVIENNKSYTQVFKTERICNLVSTSNLENSDIKISPNPTNEFFTISFQSEKILTAKLINTQGVLIKEKANYVSESKLNTANISTGIYYVQLWSEEGLVFVKKISVIR